MKSSDEAAISAGRALHVVLSIIYAGISVVSLISLARRVRGAWRRRWRTGHDETEAVFSSSSRNYAAPSSGIWIRWFHVFFLLGCWVRAAYFIFLAARPTADMVVTTPDLLFRWLGSFFFFSCFWLVLGSWAMVYHAVPSFGSAPQSQVEILEKQETISSRSLSLLKLNRFLATINAVILSLFATCVVVYTVATLTRRSSAFNPIRTGLHAFTVFVYAVLAIGFAVYGFLIIRRISGHSSPGSTRARLIIVRVGGLTAVCTVAFLARAGVVAWQLIVRSDSYEKAEFFWFDPVYFFLGDIVPLVMMLSLLRQMPAATRVVQRGTVERTSATPLLASRVTKEEPLTNVATTSPAVTS